jgi:hypothetical protein
MSDSDPEEDLPQGILPVRIPPAVTDRRLAAYLGTLKFELHQELFRRDGNTFLKDLATKYGCKPPRKTTVNHIERLGGSYKDNHFWR